MQCATPGLRTAQDKEIPYRWANHGNCIDLFAPGGGDVLMLRVQLLKEVSTMVHVLSSATSSTSCVCLCAGVDIYAACGSAGEDTPLQAL